MELEKRRICYFKEVPKLASHCLLPSYLGWKDSASRFVLSMKKTQIQAYICSLIFLKSSKSCKATESPSAIRLQLSAPPPINLCGKEKKCDFLRFLFMIRTKGLFKRCNRKIIFTGCCRSRRQIRRLSWLARDTGHMTPERSPLCWRPQGHTVCPRTRKK